MYHSCRSVPLPTLPTNRSEKADRAPQIECVSPLPNNRNSHATRLTPNVYIELKKDPGVPRLPNLKVRSAELQRRRSVCTLSPLPASQLTDHRHPRAWPHLNPLVAYPYPSPLRMTHHTKMRRWRPSPLSLRSPNSLHPHQPTTSCLRRPSRRLQPRQRNSCGGTTSACYTKSLTSLMSYSSF